MPITDRHARVWLHVEQTPIGDQASQYERWLTESAYLVSCDWVSRQSRLCLYSVDQHTETIRVQSRVDIGSAIRLESASIGAANVDPGVSGFRSDGTMQIALTWRALSAVRVSYKVFIQLLDADGRLVRQIDREPVNSFRPTRQWQTGEEIQDRYAIPLTDLSPGRYRLIVGLYDANTVERLPIRDRDGLPIGNHVELITIEVR